MMKVGKEGWERTGGKSWGPKETMRPPNKKEGPDCLTKCSHEAGARAQPTEVLITLQVRGRARARQVPPVDGPQSKGQREAGWLAGKQVKAGSTGTWAR